MGTTKERAKRSTYWLYDKHRTLVSRRRNKKISDSEFVRQAIEEKAARAHNK